MAIGDGWSKPPCDVVIENGCLYGRGGVIVSDGVSYLSEFISMWKKKVRYKLKRVVLKISPKLAEALGYDFALKAPNRTFLERPVFDYLNNKFGT